MRARTSHQPRFMALALRVIAVVALAATGFFVQDRLTATTAQAACDGVGAPVTDTWFRPIGGGAFVAYGREEARETCDNNGQYLGKVFDIREDGSCVRSQFVDGSFSGVQGISCDAAGANYLFNDQTGNSSASYRLWINDYFPGFLSITGY